jgi:hypothetical protein
MFAGRRGGKRDITLCIVYGQVLFFLGPNATFLGFDDEESLASLIFYNYGLYTFAYTLGLLWTHLDHGVLGNIDLRWDRIRNFDPVTAAVFVVLTLVSLALAGFQLYLLYVKGDMYWYLIAYIVVTLSVALLAYILRSTHFVHCHHYILFAFLIPLT